MLGVIARADLHLTAPADAAPATHAVEVDAQAAGGSEKGGAFRKMPALARWRANNKVVRHSTPTRLHEHLVMNRTRRKWKALPEVFC